MRKLGIQVPDCFSGFFLIYWNRTSWIFESWFLVRRTSLVNSFHFAIRRRGRPRVCSGSDFAVLHSRRIALLHLVKNLEVPHCAVRIYDLYFCRRRSVKICAVEHPCIERISQYVHFAPDHLGLAVVFARSDKQIYGTCLDCLCFMDACSWFKRRDNTLHRGLRDRSPPYC